MTAGKILRMRLGINPNSSGHGLLYGGLFFLPLATAGAVLASMVWSELDRMMRGGNGGGGGGAQDGK